MLLSLVAASLAQAPNLHVIQAAAWGEVDALAAHSAPDVMIYDLESTADSHILPLLFKNPGLLLIGLDVETNRAILLAGQEARTLSLGQVKGIIEENAWRIKSEGE